MAHVLAEDLRAAVLQAAIEGRLSSTYPKDSSITNSISRIENDIKSKLRSKEIKKAPMFQPIGNDDIESVPDGWCPVRLGQISYFISKGTTPRGGKVSYVDNGVGFLRAENVAGLDKLDLSNLKYVTPELNETFLQRSIIQENDILITIAGTLGRTGLVSKEDLPLNANQAVSIVRTYPEYLDLKYLVFAMNAPSIQKSLIDLTRVTAIPNLTLEIIANISIPLPPLEEQKRIVERVDELMAKIDEYEALEKKLVELKEQFPEDMKAAILQAAMEGKLDTKEGEHVPPTGPLKKGQREFSDRDVPFEISPNWRWVHLNQIAETSLGKTLNRTKDGGDVVPYLCSINVYWDGIQLDVVKEACFTVKDREKYLLEKGDLLICEGGDSGRAAVWNKDETMFYQNALHRVRFKEENNPWFYRYVLYLYKSTGFLDDYCKGQTIKHLVQNALYSIPMPLPPIEEQRRIVEKLDKLLPLCDELAGLGA